MLTLLLIQQLLTASAVGSGGATSGGSAHVEFVRAAAPSGGATSGGAALVARSAAELPSGGATSGGTGPRSATVARVAAGGATSSGSATEAATRAIAATGGAASTGSATRSETRIATGAGGAVSGGSATVAFTPQRFAVVGSGGATAGGSAVVEFAGTQITGGGGAGRPPRNQIVVIKSPATQKARPQPVAIVEPPAAAIITEIAPEVVAEARVETTVSTFEAFATGGAAWGGAATTEFVAANTARGGVEWGGEAEVTRSTTTPTSASAAKRKSQDQRRRRRPPRARVGGSAAVELGREPLVVSSFAYREALNVKFSGPLMVKKTKRRTIKLRNTAIYADTKKALTKTITAFFKAQAPKLAAVAKRRLADLQKADDVGSITIDWRGLVPAVRKALEQTYRKGGKASLDEIGHGSFDQLNDLAAEYAEERSAALVGMKLVDGDLVPNPNAEWAITETTREKLRDAIARAFEDGMTPDDLAAEIEASTDFSEARAQLIADTELARAQETAGIEAWRASGVVSGKSWLISNAHDVPDECDENEEVGVIGLDETFPSGDDTAPAHPGCDCTVVAEIDGVEESE